MCSWSAKPQDVICLAECSAMITLEQLDKATLCFAGKTLSLLGWLGIIKGLGYNISYRYLM